GVRKCENIPRNKDDRFAALEEKWYQIDIETLTNLVDTSTTSSAMALFIIDFGKNIGSSCGEFFL
ncbi:244_t:CDS:2, partial [Entrophospora sp. SA101]